MEVTNAGIIGSLGPIEKLLDQYSNNPENRRELIKHQLLDNPFQIETPQTERTVGNNDKILHSYLTSLGVKMIKNEDASEYNIMKELEVVDLEEMLDVYEQDPENFDPLQYIKDNFEEVEE